MTAMTAERHPPPQSTFSAASSRVGALPPNAIGQLGPYIIESLLGRGAAAAVYRARVDEADARFATREQAICKLAQIPRVGGQPRLALKVLSVEGATRPELRASFEREHGALSKLDHPHIVQIYDAGEINGRLFTAMELVIGRTLDKWLATEETLAEPIAINVARQVAQALDHVHQRGIVHRDVKPGNLIVTADGRAKLTDFGVALDLHEVAENQVDDPHAVYGTPGYLAPEQTQATALVDGRSDLYSLGVVLYRMVTGRKPFYGTRAQVLQAHRDEPPPPPAEVAFVSPELEAVILKALAKAPADRYQSGAEMVAALDKISLVEPPEPRGFLQRLLHWR